MSEQNRIPQHVAIIMDGNGRWAELRGKERYEGHVAVSYTHLTLPTNREV